MTISDEMRQLIMRNGTAIDIADAGAAARACATCANRACAR